MFIAYLLSLSINHYLFIHYLSTHQLPLVIWYEFWDKVARFLKSLVTRLRQRVAQKLQDEQLNEESHKF